jgi:hypothetical protein
MGTMSTVIGSMNMNAFATNSDQRDKDPCNPATVCTFIKIKWDWLLFIKPIWLFS